MIYALLEMGNPLREHTFVIVIHEHMITWCSWTHAYMMFMNVVLRSFRSIFFFPFLNEYHNEKTHIWCFWISVSLLFMNMKLPDVHEQHFKVVHEKIFFALLQSANPIREHRFDVCKARCHSWSWMRTYLMFMNVILWAFMNIHFLAFYKQVTLWESTHLL